MNEIGELSGIGMWSEGNRALFSDPENELKSAKLPLPPTNPIVEISVGYNDDNIE